MKVRKIGDWTLEDRLGLPERSLVVLFVDTGDDKRRSTLREFQRVAVEHPKAEFLEVDVFENPSVASKYRLTQTPIVLVFVNGIEVARHVGTLIATTVDRALGPGCPE